MGLVKVPGLIGPSRRELREVEFLVDTSSLYTVVPSMVVSDLGIEVPVTAEVILANSRTAEVKLGVAYLRLADREGGILVGALDVPMPLLGASALEALGLRIDPVKGAIEHSRPFGPAALVSTG